MKNEILNGNVYDIGQTVNGISRFLYLNDIWYYFEKRLSREYEYDQDDLSKTVLNPDGLEDITLIGNIFYMDVLNSVVNKAIQTQDAQEDIIDSLKNNILDLVNWVKSDIAVEENPKLGKTDTPYRREKLKFLYKLEKALKIINH